MGVRLIAINDNYDSNNYKGTTLGMDVVVSNLVNTMYCRDAGKKLRTANQVKWRKGITTASAAPFGYQFDPDKRVHLSLTRQQQKSCGVFSTLRFWGWEQEI